MDAPTPLRKRPLPERIALAEAVARQNLSSAFGVQQFAEAAGLSRSRFSVAYQNHRGISAGCFLRALRMDQAVELLTQTNQPVATVGAMVGYPEPTGFGRAFRRHTGLSPSRFRTTARKATRSEAAPAPPHSMIRRREDGAPVDVPALPPLPNIAAS